MEQEIKQLVDKFAGAQIDKEHYQFGEISTIIVEFRGKLNIRFFCPNELRTFNTNGQCFLGEINTVCNGDKLVALFEKKLDAANAQINTLKAKQTAQIESDNAHQRDFERVKAVFQPDVPCAQTPYVRTMYKPKQRVEQDCVGKFIFTFNGTADEIIELLNKIN